MNAALHFHAEESQKFLNSTRTETMHLSLAARQLLIKKPDRQAWGTIVWSSKWFSIYYSAMTLSFSPCLLKEDSQSCVAPPDSSTSRQLAVKSFLGGRQVDFPLLDWWQTDVLFILQGPHPLPLPPLCCPAVPPVGLYIQRHPLWKKNTAFCDAVSLIRTSALLLSVPLGRFPKQNKLFFTPLQYVLTETKHPTCPWGKQEGGD